MGLTISEAHKDDDDLSRFSSGVEVVKSKLSKLGYDQKMSRTDFTKFATILSNREMLLKAYLHTDFKEAKEFQKKINEALDDDDNITVSDEQEDIEGNETDKEIDKFNSPYKQLQNKIRIKLIVAETSKNAFEKNLKKIISPFVNLTFQNPPEFGLFHIALGIGPWKLEWNNSSLCIPRTITGRYSILCSDINEIATTKKLDIVRNSIADVVVKWNTTMSYTQTGGNKEKHMGNCQEFIDDLLDGLGLKDNLKLSPPVSRFVKKLRERGMASMEFIPDEEFSKKYDIKEPVKFKTHIELDEFVGKIIDNFPNFQFENPHEWQLLKSFDRAFWMRFLKSKDEKYSPKNNEESGMLECPFGDPQKFSILDLSVKRV